MNTDVWTNKVTGHHFAVGPSGITLNGETVDKAPEWVSGESDMTFGPMNEWFGGPCPVAPETFVRCVFRGRRPYLGEAIYQGLPEDAKEAMWRHAPFGGRVNPQMDIVGYQVRIS